MQSPERATWMESLNLIYSLATCARCQWLGNQPASQPARVWSGGECLLAAGSWGGQPCQRMTENCLYMIISKVTSLSTRHAREQVWWWKPLVTKSAPNSPEFWHVQYFMTVFVLSSLPHYVNQDRVSFACVFILEPDGSVAIQLNDF